MATQIKKILNATSGIGDPVDGDSLVVEVQDFKEGHLYVNKTTGSVFIRKAINGVAADWQTKEGGGGVEIKSATRILNNNEIKALPTTGVEIVPAPGVGKVIKVVSAIGILDTTLGAYSNVDNSSFSLIQSNAYSSSPVPVGNFLSATEKTIIDWLVPLGKFLSGSEFEPLIVSSPSLLSLYENQPLIIKDDWNGVTDYTDGHEDNTLKVKVYYIEVTI